MENKNLLKILFIGDIVGRPGRAAVAHFLPKIKKAQEIDFVIANGENLASGKGMTYGKYQEMLEVGIDYFTSGNHIWKNQDIIPYLKEKSVKILRPANYPGDCPGLGFDTVKIKGYNVTIVNLMGQAFIPIFLESPFKIADEIAEENKNNIIVIDFHAEATSEKIALARYLDGRVAAVVGTHTHVQTADEDVLPGGTAFISDLGMTGPKNSILGVQTDIIIKQFLTALPQSHKVAVGAAKFNGAIVTIDPEKKIAVSIERVNEIFDN